MRIGLLGGSFNPAHEGHRYIAELARRRLRLDQVWLMVSPGNPLKSARGMGSFAERLASARRVSDGRRIVATGIEAALGTRYTVDTLRELRRRFPSARFVWLMGADILEQLPRWLRWTDIAKAVPFAVLPRPGYTQRALAGSAARRLAHARHPARAGGILARLPRPAWIFFPAAQHSASATAIRQAVKEHSHPQQTPFRSADDPARADAAQDAAPQAAQARPARRRQDARHGPQEGGGRRPAQVAGGKRPRP
jgi:nicotinate-nucleotide adenylyltransferase